MKIETRISHAALVALRIAVGWHFLYEGAWKLMQEGGWSAVGMLENASGPLAPVFQWMVGQSWLMQLSSFSVMLGLAAIGLSLMTGVLSRVAAVFGMMLMVMFYCCQPPPPIAAQVSAAAGHFFLIERNFLEFACFAAIAAYPTQIPVMAILEFDFKRIFRDILPGGLVFVVFAVLFGFQIANDEFKHVEAKTSATVKVHEFTALSALTNPLPATVDFAGLKLSRVALGGDLIAGHSHGRDLIWTDEFHKRYNSGVALDRLARYAALTGINAIFAELECLTQVTAAAKAVGGELNFFANCAQVAEAEQAVRGGAKGVYLRPEVADALVKQGDIAALKALFDGLRKCGVPTGFGAEDLATVKAAVQAGIAPDFWVVAFHTLEYPAAECKVEHNSIWCRDPEAVAAYMNAQPKPWVAIRVLAGGGIFPKAAMKFSFDHKATLVAMDMLDYQVVDNVNQACELLGVTGTRQKAEVKK